MGDNGKTFEKAEDAQFTDPNKPVMPQPVQPFPSPQPEPTWPKLEMPPSPDVPHAKTDKALPDCEGFVNVVPESKPNNPNIPPPAPGKKRILIGIPLLAVTYEFLESFLKFWSELLMKPDPRYEVGYQFVFRSPVHMAEEKLVNVALENKCTHILFMDDDIYDITKADLDKLVEADKDVIGGVMHASKFPHAMCVFRRYNPDDRKVIDMPVDTSIYRLYEVPCLCSNCKAGISHWDAKFCLNCGTPLTNLVQQADLIPFAFTLMNLSVFDKIKKPWFHCTTKYPTDSWFADRLIEAGMTEYAHMAVRLNHAGVTDETKPHLMQMGMAKAKKAQGVVELTPDQMEAHQRMLINKMNETEAKQRSKPPFAGDGRLAANAFPTREENLTLVTHGQGQGR